MNKFEGIYSRVRKNIKAQKSKVKNTERKRREREREGVNKQEGTWG